MSRTDDRRSALSIPLGPIAGDVIELEVTALAAGGDGVARDAGGRVTFVPRTAPGDRVRARIVKTTSSLAHAELLEVVTPSEMRVEPPCPHFELGCGGCAWQHVARDEQLRAKQTIVSSALRRLAGLDLHPIANPAPSFGWRRRARFHIANGRVGLYAMGTQRVLSIDHCPQLEPKLDAALAVVRTANPPDGELAMVVGHTGDVALGVQKPWLSANELIGRADIRGVVTSSGKIGAPLVELEPALFIEPWDFAQASADGNAKMIDIVRFAVGKGPGKLVELFAGGGNFTRAFFVDDWDVHASDVVVPPGMTLTHFEVGPAKDILAKMKGPIDRLVLDPPRAGAADCMPGIAKLGPPVVVYIACDPSTLARDAEMLVAAGYHATDAWPIDLMPQTAHVEVVLRLERT
jgi:23S rRNA (uracil1939-C5)-methyltransferase